MRYLQYSVIMLALAGLLLAGNLLANCGSKGTQWVRNSWGKANFSGACKAHDDCYDTCGRSKSNCDRDFLGNMRTACNRAYSKPYEAVTRNACNRIADGYYEAVSRMGGDAYRKAQREKGCR